MITKISKTIFLLFLSFIFPLFVPGITDAIENPYKNHYPFKTVIIHYKVAGYETGEEILYVNSKFQAIYINTNYQYLGKTKPKKGLILTTPKFIYTIDLIKKTGTKLKSLKTSLMKEFDNLPESEKIIVKKNVEELGTAIVGNIDGKRAPLYEKIIGTDCDLIEIFGERLLVWPGANIPLKLNRKSEYDDKIVVTAVRIEKNVAISPDKFEIPKGILITFDKSENEVLENKIMTQFHFMRSSNAVKKAKEDIAIMFFKKRLMLSNVKMDIPKDEDDSIFLDESVLKDLDKIYKIHSKLPMEDDGGDGSYEFD